MEQCAVGDYNSDPGNTGFPWAPPSTLLSKKAMRRTDHLMAQRVDVAIVFRDMLGPEDAAAYMARNGIPDSVARRVLAGMAVTRINDGPMVEYLPTGPAGPGHAADPVDPVDSVL